MRVCVQVCVLAQHLFSLLPRDRKVLLVVSVCRRPHNTAYACFSPPLEVKQLFICLILWVAENVISWYLHTNIDYLCCRRRAMNQSKVNENFTWYNSIHNAKLCTFAAHRRPTCSTMVPDLWPDLDIIFAIAWLMVKLFIWQPEDSLLWCGRQLLVFGIPLNGRKNVSFFIN